MSLSKHVPLRSAIALEESQAKWSARLRELFAPRLRGIFCLRHLQLSVQICSNAQRKAGKQHRSKLCRRPRIDCPVHSSLLVRMGLEAGPRPPPAAVSPTKVAVHERPRNALPARLDQSAARNAPLQAQSQSTWPRYKVAQDFRKKLPSFLRRWTGYRPPEDAKPPHKPLAFPPFTWLAKLPLKYETWILSTIGAFVGIALLEVIISAAFPNDGTILIGALLTNLASLSSA